MISNVADCFLIPKQKRFHLLQAASGAEDSPRPKYSLWSHISSSFRKKRNINTPSSLFTKSCLGHQSVSMEAATVFVSGHGQQWGAEREKASVATLPLPASQSRDSGGEHMEISPFRSSIRSLPKRASLELSFPKGRAGLNAGRQPTVSEILATGWDDGRSHSLNGPVASGWTLSSQVSAGSGWDQRPESGKGAQG